MKFDLNDYKDRYAMHCATKKEAEDFCNYLHSEGRKWFSGKSYKEQNGYEYYGDDGVYCFNTGERLSILRAVLHGYNILEWSNYMNKPFFKSDLRTGDIIKRRNGSVEIVLKNLDIVITPTGQTSLNNFLDDLTYKHQGEEISASVDADLDIVAVRRPTKPEDCRFDAFEKECGELVYEREEVESMTLEDVCAALGKKIKIVDSE